MTNGMLMVGTAPSAVIVTLPEPLPVSVSCAARAAARCSAVAVSGRPIAPFVFDVTPVRPVIVIELPAHAEAAIVPETSTEAAAAPMEDGVIASAPVVAWREACESGANRFCKALLTEDHRICFVCEPAASEISSTMILSPSAIALMNIKRKAVPDALPTPFNVSKDILGVFDIS